jgi:ABC-type lipoprotein export system ATPase subunit
MSSINHQRINSLYIKQLKHLKDVEISFEDKAITAILGPNGHGKSTVLHALACCYQPIDANITVNNKFSDFFLPNPDAQWQGSELTLFHSYKNGQEKVDRHPTDYRKSDRWTIYARRPKRHIYYLGIDKYIPIIESEKQKTKVEYTTTTFSDNLAQLLLEKASFIFNKKYTAYNHHKSRTGKTYIGVESNGTRYSALSMSAGEQKVFLLLETIFKADEYSLILIDEIDLLLHNIALENLLKIISERANQKKLQIVFTTHRESLIELSDFLNIRHIVNKIDKIHQTEKTFCFNETKPDAIHRLTGKQEREIEIFVEDDLAVAIVEKIASDLKIKKYVDIKKFGAASNCFTTIAGLLISGENCQNKLFVLDGDVHNTDEDKRKQIKKKLTGNGQQIEDLQNQAFQQITQFNLPEKTKPEEYLHKLLAQINNLESEIIEVARSISAVDNSHKYISDIINRLNYDKSVGYTKIIDIISTLPEWQNYVSEILNWLKERVSQVREDAL